MSTTSRIPVEIMLSKFNKRDDWGNRGVDDGDGRSPVAIVGLVVAVLTLLVGIVSLRSSRFRRWVSHLLPSRFIKEALGITLQDPTSAVVTTMPDSSSIPTPEVQIPSPVFIYNDYSNAHLVEPHFCSFSYGQDGSAGGGCRVQQALEPLVPGRPGPVVAGKVPVG
ncbi:unnamed protein product [Tuber aestivum]|uniref:Uncharacterized protein n=1 Tax=Tuber aestivum TaxID=59557 RepID=A0A292PUY8_9PEZI|nr:unnamed protein product [Tuber aestivum]